MPFRLRLVAVLKLYSTLCVLVPLIVMPKLRMRTSAPADVDQHRGPGRGVDGQVRCLAQVGPGDVEYIQRGLVPVRVYWLYCQVTVPLVARVAQQVAALRRYVAGGAEVDHAALAAAAVGEADAVNSRSGIDGVAVGDLSVVEAEIGAADQVVAGAVRVGELAPTL